MGYKLKTHSGAKKRFKKTGTGKVKRGHAFMRHILTSKSTKTKRKLDIDGLVSAADAPKIKRMIPYQIGDGESGVIDELALLKQPVKRLDFDPLPPAA